MQGGINLYSILIIGFYIIAALAVAGVAVFIYSKKFSDAENTENDTDDTTFQNSRLPVSFNSYSKIFVYFLLIIQIIMLFPYAIAFNKLRFFVFVEIGIFVFCMILYLLYAIQKNMLRTKE